MRTKKIIIIIVGFLFCFSICSAQQDYGTPSQQLVQHKKQIEITPYIFEGKVMQEKSYYGKNQIIGTCIVQITKIYKGSPQLKLGSIKVVAGQQDYRKDGGLKIMSTPSEGREVGVYKGGNYIFFCRDADTSWCVDSTTTDNIATLTIWGMEEVIVISTNDSVSWYNTPQFKTIEDIDTFFKENGLTVQEEVQQK